MRCNNLEITIDLGKKNYDGGEDYESMIAVGLREDWRW